MCALCPCLGGGGPASALSYSDTRLYGEIYINKPHKGLSGRAAGRRARSPPSRITLHARRLTTLMHEHMQAHMPDIAR